MKAKKLVGIGLITIGSLSAGYLLGGAANAYLPSIPVKIFVLLAMLCSGVYLIVKNRKCVSSLL